MIGNGPVARSVMIQSLNQKYLNHSSRLVIPTQQESLSVKWGVGGGGVLLG